MESHHQSISVQRRHNKALGSALHFLSNNTAQLMEMESLYNGIEALMTAQISHYILPHDYLQGALMGVQNYLHANQRHLTLSRTDYAFYYNEAKFRTFRHETTLFVVKDVPVTARNLNARIQIYDLITMPVQTDYYSLLATDITTVGFSPDADHLIQVTGHKRLPDGYVWSASDVSLTIVDRNRPTCVRALIVGNLAKIKATCHYTIHKNPYPRSVTQLQGNMFLLINISELHMNCPNSNNTGNELLTIHLTKVQSIYTFDCHCFTIHADEIRIVPDLRHCEDIDIFNMSTIHYPINIAYLSEYSTADQLSSLRRYLIE